MLEGFAGGRREKRRQNGKKDRKLLARREKRGGIRVSSVFKIAQPAIEGRGSSSLSKDA